MNIPIVRQATEAELASVVNTLTVAFAVTPLIAGASRWRSVSGIPQNVTC